MAPARNGNLQKSDGASMHMRGILCHQGKKAEAQRNSSRYSRCSKVPGLPIQLAHVNIPV